MARKSSTRSGSNKPQDTMPDSVSADTAGEMGGDTVVVGDDTLGEDAVAAEPEAGERVTIEPGDTTASETTGDDPAQTEIVETEAVVEDIPAPAPVETVVEQRGPGMGALLIGGVVAAALGYAAAFFGLQNDTDTSAIDAALAEATASIEAQQGTITALEAQIAALAAVEAPVIPEVDLSGVESTIAMVAGDVSGVATTVESLTGRIVALEDRPIFTGEVAEDSAAMAAAVEALEARLTEERTAAAEAVAASEAAQAAAAAQLQEASSAAQTAIAEAEARAQATADATQTQAALSRVQIAMASGDPFANALADLPGEVPAGLSAVAETGVPTIEELQAAFPAAARAALPIALRETAGDSAADRVGAFFLGQIGGRSVEPREGDDPDAVLSRAEAAVAASDLPTALSEISALPDGAQAMLEDWVAQVETRAAADAALAELAATLDN
jgi:hypothetical protein